MKRKLLFTLLLGSLYCLFALSQTYRYEYDMAGNRISRSVIVLRSSVQKADTLSDQYKTEREGISKTLSECKVSVYPNPTRGEVNVAVWGGDEEAVSEITVFSNSGQLLITRQITGNTTLSIDLSPYVNGFYLINFKQRENVSYYKIIKK